MKTNKCAADGTCEVSFSMSGATYSECEYFGCGENGLCKFREDVWFDKDLGLYDWFDRCANQEALANAKMEEL